jgi:hypothetical protein
MQALMAHMVNYRELVDFLLGRLEEPARSELQARLVFQKL